MKLNCIVKHQTLTVCGSEAAEKSVNYLECVFYFLSDDWGPGVGAAVGAAHRGA